MCIFNFFEVCRGVPVPAPWYCSIFRFAWRLERSHISFIPRLPPPPHVACRVTYCLKQIFRTPSRGRLMLLESLCFFLQPLTHGTRSDHFKCCQSGMMTSLRIRAREFIMCLVVSPLATRPTRHYSYTFQIADRARNTGWCKLRFGCKRGDFRWSWGFVEHRSEAKRRPGQRGLRRRHHRINVRNGCR